MSTCGICLEEFDPPVYQTWAHQACLDSESVVRLQGNATKLRERLTKVEGELARVSHRGGA